MLESKGTKAVICSPSFILKIMGSMPVKPSNLLLNFPLLFTNSITSCLQQATWLKKGILNVKQNRWAETVSSSRDKKKEHNNITIETQDFKLKVVQPLGLTYDQSSPSHSLRPSSCTPMYIGTVVLTPSLQLSNHYHWIGQRKHALYLF